MHTVREFLEAAFAHAGLDWREHMETDPRYLRPAEVDALQADASLARRELGWSHRVGFHELVGIMVDAEIDDLAGRVAGIIPSALAAELNT